MKYLLHWLLPAAAALAAFTALPAAANQALATAKSCMACHGVDKKLVGPAFKDIARRYAGNKDADALLVTKIMKGSRGAWGPVPMPPNTRVSEAEAKKLSAWMMSLTRDAQ